jgi:hypothetical protein
MNKELPQSQDNLTLDKILPISPSDWSSETIKQYLYPEEYYTEKLQEEDILIGTIIIHKKLFLLLSYSTSIGK